MHELYLWVVLAEVVIIAVLTVRVVAGPTVSDRIVAVNAMSTQCAIGLMFYSAYASRPIYLDVAIWMASFSYLGAIVWSRYLERGLL